MLYTKEELFNITVRIYEYLQVRVMKDPHCFKYEKHSGCVERFCALLPADAGADFIYEFAVYQFYMYQTQNHGRRPTVTWFFGREALRRWREASEESKWYAREWGIRLGFENPAIKRTVYHVTDGEIEKERYRMSRISGPNYCCLKFSNPYTPDEGCCAGCPFTNDCNVLFGGGGDVYREVASAAVIDSNMIKIRGDVRGV